MMMVCGCYDDGERALLNTPITTIGKMTLNTERNQKLTFYEKTITLNEDSMKGETVLNTLFQEWAKIVPIDELSDLNGLQVVENGWTHTAYTNWISRISNDMLCYVNEWQPDKSVRKKLFKVIGFQPQGQENRYMLIKLSEMYDGTGSA